MNNLVSPTSDTKDIEIDFEDQKEVDDFFYKEIVDTIRSIKKDWKLTSEEIYALLGLEGIVNEKSLEELNVKNTTKSTFERMVFCVHIQEILDVVFPSKELVKLWLDSPHELLEGWKKPKPKPIELLQTGDLEDLKIMHRFVLRFVRAQIS